MNKLSLSNKVRAGYGIGDFAICLYWSGVGLYLLYFYTDVIGISPLLAGWIYALGIAWDAVTDPFMGYIAERTRTKMGSYRPYMFYGSIPLAFSFVLLFWAPPFEGNLLFFFLLIVNLFHRSCFTIVSVPYSSLTARMTDDSDERTKLTTARMIAASFGTLSMSALGFPIVAWYGEGNEALGFVFLGAISGLIALVVLGVTIKSVQERQFKFNKESLPSFSKVTKSVANNYPFWIVFSSILILGSTSIMFNKNLIYYVKYALDMHDSQGLILGVLSATAFLSIPFWSFLALKIGKKNAWLGSMTILFSGLIIFYLYPIKGISELLIILGFIGIGNGATGVLFWSMLPDTIEYGEWKTGIRTESSLYGFMTFAQKGAIAVAALSLGWILTIIEFTPNTIQSIETIENLKFIMAWIPIAGIFISFILVCFYPIDSSFHKKLIEEINEKSE
ncbi:glycoside-pentoside-hexuronide (GPH):cation symporter [SAR86 cluster bacterium]|jgi:GPH family glycoside/pentoside/hexuronide:cation symporter|nr:glycoside-pentoside-hexuronide (GPH):cation symporter [SAR86 cluster bacterium]